MATAVERDKHWSGTRLLCHRWVMRLFLLFIAAAALAGCTTSRRTIAPPPSGSEVLRAAELSRVRCLLVGPIENTSDSPAAADLIVAAVLERVAQGPGKATTFKAVREVFAGTPLELPESISPGAALELAELLGVDGVVYGSVEGRSSGSAPVLLMDLRLALAGSRDILFATSTSITTGPNEAGDLAAARAAGAAMERTSTLLGPGPADGCADPHRVSRVRELALATARPKPAATFSQAPEQPAPPAPPAPAPAVAITPTPPPAADAKRKKLTPRQAELATTLSGGTRIILEGVSFEGRSAKIVRNAGLSDLAAAVASMDEGVRIEGYVDRTEDTEGDAKASMEMAKAVRDKLVKLGVPTSQLSIAGRGGNNPRLPNFTPRGRSANRRVEVVRAR
jgi:outer membrane protein OmpA-like peptidoglycan-associated protein